MNAEISLYRVAEDFAQLIHLRDIMQSEGEDIGPLDQTIAEYFSHDVTRDKIDTVIGFLRHAETMEAAARAESERCLKMARSFEAQRTYLKVCVQQVMELAGKKLLEGNTAGTLRLKGNGGRQAVEITDASLIPEEMCQYTGTISGAAWKSLRQIALDAYPGMSCLTPEQALADWEEWSGRQDVQLERIPHKGRIGEALAKDCQVCEGAGKLPYDADAPEEICAACGGSGKESVPGARLLERGAHVEIR